VLDGGNGSKDSKRSSCSSRVCLSCRCCSRLGTRGDGVAGFKNFAFGSSVTLPLSEAFTCRLQIWVGELCTLLVLGFSFSAALAFRSEGSRGRLLEDSIVDRENE